MKTLYCSTLQTLLATKEEKIYEGNARLQSKKEHWELYRALCEGYKQFLDATKHIGPVPKLLSVSSVKVTDLDSDSLW